MTDHTSAHDTLWDLIHKTRFGMLTHRDADGQLHSQPLTTQNRSNWPHGGALASASNTTRMRREVRSSRWLTSQIGKTHRRHVVQHAHHAGCVAGDVVHHRADAHALRAPAPSGPPSGRHSS
jgi:general stress protein 26